METNNLNKKETWLITIKSKRILSNKDRDIIVELVSEEARKKKGNNSFILHEVVESKKNSQIILEGTKTALNNLLSVCKDNLTFDINYKKIR